MKLASDILSSLHTLKLASFEELYTVNSWPNYGWKTLSIQSGKKNNKGDRN